ncbi:MAG: TonB-dependent receptor [Caulobacterales bacterium]|nr:TonB-dependent receptor [Caulobacterales bacterium]
MALAWSYGATAQEEGEEAAQPDTIIVYSQKQAQSLQEVPVAVTAITAEAVEDNFVTDLSDVGFLAPNVQLQPVSTFPGFANFTVRGIGNSTSIRTLDPSVNIVQDGMVLATQIGAVLDVFDVESVEVLRGPQGIFFGRNTTGGAVLLRTAKPSEDIQMRAKGAIGSHNLSELEAVVEGPVSDVVRAKLAVQYRQQDGLFEDNNGGFFTPAPQNPSGLQPDNPRTDQSEQDSVLIKPTVTFAPNDRFDVTVFGQYFLDTGGGTASRMFEGEGAPGTTAAHFGYAPPSDPYEINHDLIGDSETSAWHVIAEANLDLGHGVVTSVTGFRDLSFESSLDVDGTPFPLIHFPDNDETAEQFTQEVRYASAFSEKFDFLIGAFFMDSEMSVIERREFSGLTAGRAHTDFNFIQSDWTQDQRSYAVFGNANYDITPALTASAGLRYSYEEKDLDISPLLQCAGPGFTNCQSDTRFQLDDDWSNVSPRAGVEYQASEDVLTYATWTRGFRSGNFNARASSPATIAAADPEQADQFEVGVKSELFDRTLRANVAGFVTLYDDIQRVTNTVDATGQPLQRLRNAASATIKGVEAEISWRPTSDLTLQGSFGWIDPEFDEFTGLDFDNDGVVTPEENARAEALEFDRVPNYTVFLAGDYRLPVPQVPGDVTFRAQWSYRDEFPTDVRNTPIFFQDSYDLLDMSLRYETENVRVALFGRNITDEEYADIRSPAFNAQAFGGQPRTYGVEVTWTY